MAVWLERLSQSPQTCKNVPFADIFQHLLGNQHAVEPLLLKRLSILFLHQSVFSSKSERERTRWFKVALESDTWPAVPDMDAFQPTPCDLTTLWMACLYSLSKTERCDWMMGAVRSTLAGSRSLDAALRAYFEAVLPDAWSETFSKSPMNDRVNMLKQLDQLPCLLSHCALVSLDVNCGVHVECAKNCSGHAVQHPAWSNVIAGATTSPKDELVRIAALCTLARFHPIMSDQQSATVFKCLESSYIRVRYAASTIIVHWLALSGNRAIIVQWWKSAWSRAVDQPFLIELFGSWMRYFFPSIHFNSPVMSLTENSGLSVSYACWKCLWAAIRYYAPCHTARYALFTVALIN
jgi:hypothetical protein